MTGATATQGAVWPVTSAVPAAENWRPGGTLPIAYNDATKQLYIAMHDHGFEGSHKFPATEIWKVDIVSHKVETRGHADGAVSIAVSAGPKPLVFTVNGPNSSLSRYDGQTLAKLGETKKDFLEGGGPLMVQ
jgi:methylamine dehydrogenase heavy chain